MTHDWTMILVLGRDTRPLAPSDFILGRTKSRVQIRVSCQMNFTIEQIHYIHTLEIWNTRDHLTC